MKVDHKVNTVKIKKGICKLNIFNKLYTNFFYIIKIKFFLCVELFNDVVDGSVVVLWAA